MPYTIGGGGTGVRTVLCGFNNLSDVANPITSFVLNIGGESLTNKQQNIV
jgi:hypothetical protein